MHASEKAAIFSQEGQRHAPFGAERHQKWRTTDLPETGDSSEGMNWHTKLGLAINANGDGFAILSEQRSLHGHIQCVEKRPNRIPPVGNADSNQQQNAVG